MCMIYMSLAKIWAISLSLPKKWSLIDREETKYLVRKEFLYK